MQEVEAVGAHKLLPTKQTDKKARYTNPFLVFAIILAGLVIAFSVGSAFYAPTTAHAFDETDWHNNLDRKEGTSDNWDTEYIGGDKYPNWTQFPHSLYYFLYTLFEGLAGGAIDQGDQILENSENQTAWTLDFDNSYFHDIFVAISKICENIIQPVAVGFLGLALVLEFLQFAKEVLSKNGDGWSHLGSYLMLSVKYVIILTLINHAMLLCRAIYGLFLAITQAVIKTVSVAAMGQAPLNSFMINMQKTTYANFGQTALDVLLALVILIAVIVMMVQVFGILLTRMLEIYIMSAFSGFPLVMLCNDHFKQGGIAFFKHYASVCLQAAIVVVIMAFAGIVFATANALFVPQDPSIGAVFELIAIFASCFAIVGMVKQSKELSNKILGVA